MLKKDVLKVLKWLSFICRCSRPSVRGVVAKANDRRKGNQQPRETDCSKSAPLTAVRLTDERGRIGGTA